MAGCISALLHSPAFADTNRSLHIERHQDPGQQTGASISFRNTETQPADYTLGVFTYDIFGKPIENHQKPFTLKPNETGRHFVPVSPEMKCALIRSRLRKADGQTIATGDVYIAIEPCSLQPIEGSDRFGLSMFPYLPRPQENRMLDLLGAVGCKTVRGFEMDRSLDVKNKDIVPHKMDRLINRMRSVGITHILSILAYCPPWASTLPEDRPYSERRHVMPKLEEWNRLLKKYAANTNFDSFEVWNEPNGGSWNSFPKSTTYAKLLKASYHTIKKVRPDAIVVSAGANHGGTGWPESILQKAPGCADVVAFHSYRYGNRIDAPELGKPGFPSYPTLINNLLKMTARYNNGKPLPLWNTEFGYRYPEPHKASFDANDQAKYLIRSFLVLASCGVERSYNFQLKDSKGPKHPFKFGLCYSDLSIKPSWLAFRTLNQQVAGKSIGPFRSLSQNLCSVLLKNKDNKTLAVWSIKHPAVIAVKKDVQSIQDLYGRNVPVICSADYQLCVLPAGSLMYVNIKNPSQENIREVATIHLLRQAVNHSDKPDYRLDVTRFGNSFLGKSKTVRPHTLQQEPISPSYPVGHGVLSLQTAAGLLDIPVSYEFKEPLLATFVYDTYGTPAILLQNNSSQSKEVLLKCRYGNRLYTQTLTISSTSTTIHKLEATELLDHPVELFAEIQSDDIKLSIKQEVWKPIMAGKTPLSENCRPVTIDLWHDNEVHSKPSSDDLSAKAIIAYDEKQLTLIVSVIDDHHSQPEAGGSAWLGDSVQLAFVPKDSDSFVEMLFYRTNDNRSGMYCFDPETVIENVEYTIDRDKIRTLYKISLPSRLLDMKMTSNNQIRFSFIINENDGDGRKGYLRWSDGIGNGKDPDKFGTVILE
jgi:hypothetical protein